MKLSASQRKVLELLAEGKALICHNTPGREHKPSSWFVEMKPQCYDVHAGVANGLQKRGFLKPAGRDGNSTLWEISDEGRKALESTSQG